MDTAFFPPQAPKGGFQLKSGRFPLGGGGGRETVPHLKKASKRGFQVRERQTAPPTKAPKGASNPSLGALSFLGKRGSERQRQLSFQQGGLPNPTRGALSLLGGRHSVSLLCSPSSQPQPGGLHLLGGRERQLPSRGFPSSGREALPVPPWWGGTHRASPGKHSKGPPWPGGGAEPWRPLRVLSWRGAVWVPHAGPPVKVTPSDCSTHLRGAAVRGVPLSHCFPLRGCRWAPPDLLINGCRASLAAPTGPPRGRSSSGRGLCR